MPRPRLQHVTTSIRWASAAHKLPQRTYKPPSRPQTAPAPAPEPEPKPKPEGVLPKSSRAGTTGRILTGCIGGAVALYIGALTYSALQPVQNPRIQLLEAQKDFSERYEETADSFDSEVWLSEWLMGQHTRRDRLAKMCRGHVLEVSCGTGRNLGYFDVSPVSEVESLTFVDLSPAMIEVCKRKWAALYGNAKKAAKKLKPGLQVRFLAASALDGMPPPPMPMPSEGQPQATTYDTILQTNGLCSTARPAELLTNLASHLSTTNPSARILLLEHGRSYRDWLNRILDNAAEKHAEKYGCWANREIGEVIGQAAEEAGLEVVREKRWHLGTTWVVELKFRDPPAQEERKQGQGQAERELGEMKGSGWFSWR